MEALRRRRKVLSLLGLPALVKQAPTPSRCTPHALLRKGTGLPPPFVSHGGQGKACQWQKILIETWLRNPSSSSSSSLETIMMIIILFSHLFLPRCHHCDEHDLLPRDPQLFWGESANHPRYTTIENKKANTSLEEDHMPKVYRSSLMGRSPVRGGWPANKPCKVFLFVAELPPFFCHQLKWSASVHASAYIWKILWGRFGSRVKDVGMLFKDQSLLSPQSLSDGKKARFPAPLNLLMRCLADNC